MRRFLSQCDRVLGQILRWFSMVCLMVLGLVLSSVVFVRFFPIARLSWSDEIVEWAFAWMVFMGSAALCRMDEHFCVDAITCRLEKHKIGVYVQLLVQLLAAVFFILFTYYGYMLASQANDRSPILEWPRPLWYSSMPVAGAIMSLYSLRTVIRLLGDIFHRPLEAGPSEADTGAD